MFLLLGNVTSKEIQGALSAGGTTVTLQSLFTAEQWASSQTKIVTLPAATERGSSVVAQPAISIGPDGWGGELIFDVYGTVSGAGGNDSVGGDAIDANRLGLSGQKVKINIKAGGVVRAGGGAGGDGGQGGPGTFTQTLGPNWSNDYNWSVFYGGSANWFIVVRWAGVAVINGAGPYNQFQAYDLTQLSAGGFTYIRGALMAGDNWVGGGPEGDQGGAGQVSRRGPASSEGGAGGDGGNGQGYEQSQSEGVAGSPGSNGSGAGGEGGDGGTFGQAGNAGQTGSNGNAGSGSVGQPGYAAGNYIKNRAANAIVTNEGTVLGN